MAICVVPIMWNPLWNRDIDLWAPTDLARQTLWKHSPEALRVYPLAPAELCSRHAVIDGGNGLLDEGRTHSLERSHGKTTVTRSAARVSPV